MKNSFALLIKQYIQTIIKQCILKQITLQNSLTLQTKQLIEFGLPQVLLQKWLVQYQ